MSVPRVPMRSRAFDLARRSAGNVVRFGRVLLCGWLACVVATGCAAGRHRAHAKKDEALQLAERARLAEDRGDAAEAEELMAAAVRTNPLDCENRLALSEMQLGRGSLDKASTHLRRLVQLNPEDPRIYVRLAQTEFLRGNLREAEVWLDRGLELDPAGEQALLLKGRLAELRGRPDEGLFAYYRVLDANPDQNDARLRIARLLIEREEPIRAVPLLRDVARHEDSRPEQVARAHWMLGETLVLAGHPAEAAAEMDRALAHLTPRADDWYELALVREQAGRRDDALAAVDRALELEPGSEKARDLRATLGGDALPRLAAGERSAPPS